MLIAKDFFSSSFSTTQISDQIGILEFFLKHLGNRFFRRDYCFYIYLFGLNKEIANYT